MLEIDSEEKEEQLAQKKKELRENKRRKMQATLSFADEEEGDGSEEAIPEEALPKKKLSKDPSAQTDFLPDREREQQLAAEKERLTEEWVRQQEVIKGKMVLDSRLSSCGGLY